MVEESGLLSMRTPCVSPAFLHRQSRVEAPVHHQKSPAVKCPASFHNTAASHAAVSTSNVASYFLSIAVFVGLVFIFFSSGVPCWSRVLWPISLRTSVERLWRTSRASS